MHDSKIMKSLNTCRNDDFGERKNIKFKTRFINFINVNAVDFKLYNIYICCNYLISKTVNTK